MFLNSILAAKYDAGFSHACSYCTLKCTCCSALGLNDKQPPALVTLHKPNLVTARLQLAQLESQSIQIE